MMKLWQAGLALALVCTTAAAFAQTAAAPVAPAPAPAAAAAPAPTTAPALTAPPAPAPAANDWLSYNPYSGEQNDLKNANRTQDEVLSWANQRSTDALSFAADNINAKLEAGKKTFTQQGYSNYADYLKESKLVEMVRDQGYAVTTIVNGDTLILNSGSLAGSYHWLVEVPLMVTFIHTDPVTGEQKPVAGGNFKLTMQMGRVAQGGVDGMAIESWKMEMKPQTAAP